MVTPLEELVSLTDELEQLLDHVSQQNRQETLDKITTLLNDREIVLKQLAESPLKRDSVIEQLQQDEARIKKKMQQVLGDIKKDMQMAQRKKKSTRNYINPYQNIIQDGVFFDRKE